MKRANHNAKRIMSVLLTLCLTLGVLPVVSAAESKSAAMLKDMTIEEENLCRKRQNRKFRTKNERADGSPAVGGDRV